MPTDGKTQTYGFLNQLSTEQLLDLMREDLESLEGGDSTLTSRILEVIEKREKEEPTGLFPDVDQAWEDFQNYYNTPDSDGCPAYSMGDSEQAAAYCGTGRRHRQWRPLKRLFPLAAVLAVAFSSMVAVQAFGFDVFGALARWTAETFHFVSDTPQSTGSPESEALRQKLQEAFDSCGIDIPAPTWYPVGTELARDIDVIEYKESIMIMCDFVCEDGTFHIEVQQYHKNDRVPGYTYEKDASNVEEYHSNGRLFYIIANLSEKYATYSNGRAVIVIEGNLSLEMIKQIIDSIGA